MKLHILFPVIALCFAIISADFKSFDFHHNYKSMLFIALAIAVFLFGKVLEHKKKKNEINKQSYYLLTIDFLSNVSFAQKISLIDYIDASIRVVELFKKSNNDENCNYALEFQNKTENSISVEILIPEKDSIVKRLIIPVNEKGTSFSSFSRIYNCRIKNEYGKIIKESEYQLNECGILKIKLE